MPRTPHHAGSIATVAALLFIGFAGVSTPAYATDVSTAVQMCEDRGPDCVHHSDGRYTYINVDNGENGQQQIVCSNSTGDCVVARTRPRRPPRRPSTFNPAETNGVVLTAPAVRFMRSN